MRKILLLFAISLSLTACNKTDDDNNGNENPNFTGLIKTIKTNDSPLVEFSYDGNSKIKKKIIHNGSYQLTVEYEYSNNKLISETAKSNENIVYQYTCSYNNNDRLIRFTISGAIQSYWEMHYDNQGKIDYAIENISGAPSIKHTFTYSGDNIIEATKYNRFGNTWEMQSRFKIEYDHKHNPYYDLHLPFSEVLDEFSNLVSPDNANRIKEYDQNNILINDTQYQTTYNAGGYPAQTVENNTTTYEFIYY